MRLFATEVQVLPYLEMLEKTSRGADGRGEVSLGEVRVFKVFADRSPENCTKQFRTLLENCNKAKVADGHA